MNIYLNLKSNIYEDKIEKIKEERKVKKWVIFMYNCLYIVGEITNFSLNYYLK